jgi:hypothetical protein
VNETFWLSFFSISQKVCILVGVVIFTTTPKQGKRDYLELGLILALALVSEIASFLIHRVFHANPNSTGNIYAMLNFPLAVLLYRRRIAWTNKTTIAFLVIVPFILASGINLALHGISDFNSFGFAMEDACYIILSVIYFFILINDLPTESITRLPMFWINTANLIYYSGIFLITLSSDYLIKVLGNDMILPWIFHNFLGVVFYSMLCYAMLLIRSTSPKGSE